MRRIRRALAGVNALFRKHRLEAELDEELRAYLESSVQERMRAGMTREGATRAARVEMGSVEAVKDRTRDAGWETGLESVWQDVRYACRTLHRSPGFAAVAILTLALGIGANTAIFSVVDGILLRPLPLPHAERVVRLFETNAAAGRPRAGGSPANFADWQRTIQSMEALTATSGTSVTITGAAEPERVVCMMISRNFFALTGATPALGRAFAPFEYESLANAALGPFAIREEFVADASVIVGHPLWRRLFGGDPHIVGREVRLNGRRAEVVGVMRQDFRFDDTPSGTADCWVPLVESRMAEQRRFRQFTVIGRLKAGTDIQTAQSETNVIAAALEREHPRDNAGWGIHVAPLHESLVGEARPALLILLAGVGCVLLIACANIVNLLLMRAAGRTREVAVRMALGAGRPRLLRQWLTESMVLAIVGGCAGLGVAFWAVPALVAHAPPNLPRVDEITVDARIFAFTAAVSLVAGVVCGLAPAIGVRSGDVTRALRSSGVAAIGLRRAWLRSSLVVGEVGLAVVLLVGAGLMARTVMAVRGLDLGFEPRNVLTFGVDLRGEQYSGLVAMRAFGRELISRLEALPGVEAAGVGSVPLMGNLQTAFRVDGGGERIDSTMDVPSPGYFRALGIRLLHGRAFNEDDDQSHPSVAIVNRAFARKAWGSEHVVGRRMSVEQRTAARMTVVGVVDDLRMSSLEAEAPPVVYVPYLQSTVATFGNYVLRTTADASSAVPLVRDAVRGLDATVAVSRIAAMEERVSRVVAPRAFNLRIIGLFSLVALVLAIVGVYGLISESVAARTSEIGVRMALGAGRIEVVRLVLGRSLATTAIGIVSGLAASAAVTRYLGAALFGVTPLDPATFITVPVMFGLVATLAVLVPTRRATRLDPVVALRCD